MSSGTIKAHDLAEAVNIGQLKSCPINLVLVCTRVVLRADSISEVHFTNGAIFMEIQGDRTFSTQYNKWLYLTMNYFMRYYGITNRMIILFDSMRLGVFSKILITPYGVTSAELGVT